MQVVGYISIWRPPSIINMGAVVPPGPVAGAHMSRPVDDAATPVAATDTDRAAWAVIAPWPDTTRDSPLRSAVITSRSVSRHRRRCPQTARRSAPDTERPVLSSGGRGVGMRHLLSVLDPLVRYQAARRDLMRPVYGV